MHPADFPQYAMPAGQILPDARGGAALMVLEVPYNDMNLFLDLAS